MLDVTGAGSDQFGVPASEPGGTVKASRLVRGRPRPSGRRLPAAADAVPPPPKTGNIVIAVELFKLVRRVRTWFSIGLICALPLVVAIFIAVTHLAPPPGQGSAFLSAVLDDGQLYPAAALALVLPVFLPVAVAVVAGDSIAGEASAGTLRYLLARPVGRTRLLVAKLVSVITFTLVAVVAVTVTSYATGVLILGPSRAAAVGTAPAGWLRFDRAGRRRRAHGRAAGRRGHHVAVRHAADHPRARRARPRRHGVHHRLDARRRRHRDLPVHAHRLRARRRARRAGRAGRQRDAGHAERRERGAAVPADPVLAGVDRLLPAAHLLAGHPARVRHPGGVRGRVPRGRLG